jgi:antitoxin CcdA
MSRMNYSVREPAYDSSAARQTVSLTINADLFARIKAIGINASRVAEEALARELERHRAEQLKRDIKSDVAAMNAYVAQHGSFTDMARAHYGKKRDRK